VALLSIAACSSPPREPQPPRPIAGYVRPPEGDSLIREGKLSGRTLHLRCEPVLGNLEVGDAARCLLETGVTEGFTMTYTPLDSFPELRAANPGPVAIPRNGAVLARAEGYTQVWATHAGARVVESASVGPRTGGVRLLPAVADTTIEVGQTFRFRIAYYDTTGLEQQDRRAVAWSYARWDNPGKLDTVGLNEYALTAQAPGRMQFTAMRGKRQASVMINVIPAKVVAAPAPSPGRRTEAPRTARYLLASVRIQVIDSASPPRPIPISIGSRMLVTTRDGWYRGNEDTGTVVVAVHCPVAGGPAGQVLGDTTVRLMAGANPPLRLRVSSARCRRPAASRATDVFAGHYRNGPEETFTSCQPLGVASGSPSADRIAIVTIDAPGFTPRRLDDTTRYFARFEGKLAGPGSYGARGQARYYLRVTRVLELRPERPTDCR
jgi:hypothetical protein